MQPNPGPGKLIVMEGLDGSGTTTQAPRLAKWLRDRGIRVHITHEPTPGAAGVLLRPYLTKRFTLDGKTLAALFSADRLDHLYAMGNVVERLRDGQWVIMDRYYLSSFAYQALSLKPEELRWLWHLHEPCLIPEITFFLDVPVPICLDRIASGRAFHFEIFEKADILNNVRGNYLEAIQSFKDRKQNIQVIDGSRTINQVTDDIRRHLELLFFTTTRLSREEQERLLVKWPRLQEVLVKIEGELALSLLAITKIPGGYQLALSGREGLYYLRTAFAKNGSIAIRDASRRDAIQEQLEEVASSEISPYNQLKLPGV